MIYPPIDLTWRANERSEAYSKIAQLTRTLEWRQQEIVDLRDKVNNWKQRFIGLSISTQNDIDEDDADAFADTIKNMEE